MRPTRRHLSSLAALLMLGGGAVARAQARDPERLLTLVLGGNGQGEIEPCACPNNSVGGLARRATLLARLRGSSDGIIYASAGDDLGGPTVPEAERSLRARLILDAERMMKIDLVGLGERDRGLGVDEDALPRSVVVERAGLRVALVAVDLNQPGAASWLAQESARRRREGAQLVVALLHGETRRVIALLRRHAGIDLAVAAHDPGFSTRALQAGSARVVGVPAQGQRVTVVELHIIPGSLQLLDEKAHTTKPGRSWFTVRHLPLGADLPDDPGVAELLRVYRARVAQLPSPPPPPTSTTAAPLPAPGVFAGAPACGRCHQGAMKVWSASRHATAWVSLARGDHQRDGKCLACHLSSGTSSRPAVQCEACHGPSALHVVLPREAGHTVRDPGEVVCLPCHRVSEHVRAWNYATARAKLLGAGHQARP